MINIDAMSIICLGILDEHSVLPCFIDRGNVVGVITKAKNFSDFRSFIPGGTVGGGIKDKALLTVGSAVEDVDAVDLTDLGIADALV